MSPQERRVLDLLRSTPSFTVRAASGGFDIANAIVDLQASTPSPDKADVHIFFDHLDRLAAGETVTIGGATVSARPSVQARLNRPAYHGDYIVNAADLEALARGESVTAPDGAIFRADPEAQRLLKWTPNRIAAFGRDDCTDGSPLASPKRTPKDGDRLDSFTAAELDGLPVGLWFELPGYDPIERMEGGWRKVGQEPYTIRVGAHDYGHRALVLPKPTEAPKPAPKPPKVGDRWGDLTPEQRAALPVGTVIKEEGCITVAVWTRLPSGWVRAVVDTSDTALSSVDAQEPTKTSRIAFIPPTPESK